jgi:hypothetical protein
MPERIRRGSLEFLFDHVAETERRLIDAGRPPAMYAHREQA